MLGLVLFLGVTLDWFLSFVIDVLCVCLDLVTLFVLRFVMFMLWYFMGLLFDDFSFVFWGLLVGLIYSLFVEGACG